MKPSVFIVFNLSLIWYAVAAASEKMYMYTLFLMLIDNLLFANRVATSSRLFFNFLWPDSKGHQWVGVHKFLKNPRVLRFYTILRHF